MSFILVVLKHSVLHTPDQLVFGSPFTTQGVCHKTFGMLGKAVSCNAREQISRCHLQQKVSTLSPSARAGSPGCLSHEVVVGIT